jgi:hypothetical protein
MKRFIFIYIFMIGLLIFAAVNFIVKGLVKNK